MSRLIRRPHLLAHGLIPSWCSNPVNPATAARYRQAFKTSRAKSDPSDAQGLLVLTFLAIVILSGNLQVYSGAGYLGGYGSKNHNHRPPTPAYFI